MLISIRELFKGYYKYCECGCKILIPCINKLRKLAKFKRGHWLKTSKGDKHPSWKGGVIERDGYIMIHEPDHPNSNKKGYVYEHIKIITELIGRPLTEYEEIHHIDRNRKNNNLNNLLLLSNHSEHMKIHFKNKDIFDFKIDTSNRFCNLCGMTNEDMKNKSDNWCRDTDGYLCKYCHGVVVYYLNKFNKNVK